jgi:hypothetical protein
MSEQHTQPEPTQPSATVKKAGRFVWVRSKRTLVIGLSVLIVISGALAIPPVRYGLLGPIIQRSVTIVLTDDVTGKPVTNAVIIDNKVSATSNNEGRATLPKLAVGVHNIIVKKAYYADQKQTVTVPLTGTVSFSFKIKPTGRPIEYNVVNKLTGNPISNATMVAGDSSAITDSKGHATIILPPNPSVQKIILKADGYNDVSSEVSLVSGVTNQFSMVPSGKIYFLDKRTGTIDVMKSDLDGSNPQIVLKGTGQEDDRYTAMLASRDWKYLALLSHRNGDKASLYLITTATDKLSVIDQGDVSFDLDGWVNNNFVYTVTRLKAINGTFSQTVLKSFAAVSGNSASLDQTDTQAVPSAPDAYFVSSISKPYLTKNSIIYAKFWSTSSNYFISTSKLADKTNVIMSASGDGSTKQTLKTFDGPEYQYAYGIAYKPDYIYYRIGGSDIVGNRKPNTYYEYVDGKFQPADEINDERFSKLESTFYSAYLLSPSGSSTLWYEPRDGKNALFTGNESGTKPKQIAGLTDYIPYGWYSDNYILLSKSGSELFIAPSDYSQAPMKITDYHKPSLDFRGYGGGYGGN